MGTRHEIKIIIDNEVKVCQYGQWDGYLSGQGVGIAHNFRHIKVLEDDVFDKRKLAMFSEKVRALKPLTDGQLDEVDNTPNWPHVFPHLSRDAGADIIRYIEAGVNGVFLSDENENDKWCEFFYKIDLDHNVISVGTNRDYSIASDVPLSDWTEDYVVKLGEAAYGDNV